MSEYLKSDLQRLHKSEREKGHRKQQKNILLVRILLVKHPWNKINLLSN